MKITTPFIIVLVFFFVAHPIFAASSAISTRIDVTGATNADCVWFVTNPLCSHSFDNGWDGYETNTSSSFVQIYAQEIDNNKYQIDVVDDVNNVPLYFKAGLDTVYTLSVMHQNLSNAYKVLYLYDVVMDTLIDITSTGAKYVFHSPKLQPALKRFVVYTSHPQWVSGGIATEIKTPISKQIGVYSVGSSVCVNNETELSAKIQIVDATSGMVATTLSVAPNHRNVYPTDLKPGVYIAIVNTNFSSNIIKFRII
jgi:hypothetical protein